MNNFTLSVKSPWGPLSLVGNTQGLLHIKWTARKSDKKVPDWAVAAKKYIESLFTDQNDRQMKNWSEFEIPVVIEGSFDTEVYKQLVRTKKGQTVSYKKLAEMIGKKNASRAVGSAMRRNPLPLLIPCHRVIKSDGKLGNYSAPGGITKKQEILSIERQFSALKAPKSLMGPRIKFLTNI